MNINMFVHHLSANDYQNCNFGLQKINKLGLKFLISHFSKSFIEIHFLVNKNFVFLLAITE